MIERHRWATGLPVEAESFLRLLEVAADDVGEIFDIGFHAFLERIQSFRVIRRDDMYHLWFLASS